MTSPSPLLYDTYYHIYNRGVNRENIFFEERNYDLFLKLYEKHLASVTDLFAYCMLRNHFHVSLRVTSEEEIMQTLKTRKVSAPSTKHNLQNSSACHDEGSQRKPLGFESLRS